MRKNLSLNRIVLNAFSFSLCECFLPHPKMPCAESVVTVGHYQANTMWSDPGDVMAADKSIGNPQIVWIKVSKSGKGRCSTARFFQQLLTASQTGTFRCLLAVFERSGGTRFPSEIQWGRAATEGWMCATNWFYWSYLSHVEFNT